MSDDLRACLMAAATAGEIISVVYHRASQPGTVREIAPIAITDDEVRARDIAAGMDKVFKLAYLELAGPQTTLRAYDPAAPPSVEVTQTVQTALTPHVPALQALGWHAELTEHRISLHLFFKNGKARNGYAVTMGFDEFTVDMFGGRSCACRARSRCFWRKLVSSCHQRRARKGRRVQHGATDSVPRGF